MRRTHLPARVRMVADVSKVGAELPVTAPPQTSLENSVREVRLSQPIRVTPLMQAQCISSNLLGRYNPAVPQVLNELGGYRWA